MKRAFDSSALATTSAEQDRGWQAPDPIFKRTRQDDSGSDFEVSDNDDGWNRWAGDMVDQDVDMESDTTTSERDIGDRRAPLYDSDSDSDHVPHVTPDWVSVRSSESSVHSDVNMPENDGWNFHGSVDSDVDMSAGHSNAHDDDVGSDVDMSEECSDSGDKQEAPMFPKQMRKLYESLMNAPSGAPVTKHDLAGFYKVMETVARQPQPSPASPKKSTQASGTTRHRPDGKLTLQRQVRETVAFVMKREKNEPLTDAHVPSRNAVERFANTKKDKHGPQISHLKVDVATTTIASPWNTQAIYLLCQYFRNNVTLDEPVSQKALAAAFKTHFKNLRRLYKDSAAGDGPVARQNRIDANAKHADETRIATLLAQRINAAEHFAELDPKLRKLLPFLKSLTKDVMSGDERSHAHGNARYVVKTLDWRQTVPLFSTLDSLHLSTRFNAESAGPGKFPHPRIRNTARPPQSGKPVSGLPRNLYNPDWLAKQTALERRRLKIKPDIDMTISPDLLRHAARFHHVIDGSTPPLDINDPRLPPIPKSGPSKPRGKRVEKGNDKKG
ncbi:hypothetical protein B0H12DRAFT_1236554 [Mycena haematopus]|nr:hypothetical protein B0H12DRAFT_1236554 [Mycena haematopus]